jgi:uncharacterized protein YwgA
MDLNFQQKIILNFLIVDDKKSMFPIQLMKAIFLYLQEEKPKDFYEFSPYLYGPCSFDVYADLKLLEDNGFITSYPTYRGWSFFGITSEGEKHLMSDTKVIRKLDEIKKTILSKPFIELLKYVYSKYPEFTQNSIFNNEALKKL